MDLFVGHDYQSAPPCVAESSLSLGERVSVGVESVPASVVIAVPMQAWR